MEIASSSGLRRADGISDYKELDSYITIKNGTSHGTISILIYDDVIAELSEYFQVAITKVETFSNATSQHFPMIGTNNRINVVIRENDHPYGLFRISLDNSSSPGNNDKLTNIVEPTEGNIPVEIHIARMFGKYFKRIFKQMFWFCSVVLLGKFNFLKYRMFHKNSQSNTFLHFTLSNY